MIRASSPSARSGWISSCLRSPPAPRERQEHFYAAQLALAAEFGLPVLLHVRKSQDILLKHLRRHGRIGGIAHAFNGSAQQAQAFVDLGFALGMGGAMTYERALQIRRHATDVALEHLVLETDAPDIPPAWLHPPDRRNRPGELARIADTLATLRGLTPEQVARATSANALRVLPGWPGLSDDARLRSFVAICWDEIVKIVVNTSF